jgi:hypothetical protein
MYFENIIRFIYVILIPEIGFSLKFIKYDNQDVFYGSLLTFCFYLQNSGKKPTLPETP